MEQNKVRKYLLYALGEILLVMIGILLALQINNWNELKKERITELNYLVGIKSDLENDIPRIENRINNILRKISILHKIDSTYVPDREVQPIDVSIDSITIGSVFDRGSVFRLTSGSYETLTSNASAGLIKNVDLFQRIQTLYAIRALSTRSIYEDIKRREEYVGWKYAHELKYSDFEIFFINNPNREEVLADFDYYYRQQVLMFRHLSSKRDLMINIVNDIENEIKKRN